jgi:polyisoprenoid-binding protein YceI
MRFSFACAVFIVAGSMALTPASAGEIYKFDSAHSRIAFQVHHFLGTATGKFQQFSGTIDLDRDHPERSSVSARIDVKSIDTGIGKRDDHLRGAEFFNVSKFPEIIFKSRNVKQTGRQSADIMGDLTMHGVTKPMVLHVKLLNEPPAEHSRWQVTTDPINRRDFDLMFSNSAEAISGIGREVTTKIEIEAVRSK